MKFATIQNAMLSVESYFRDKTSPGPEADVPEAECHPRPRAAYWPGISQALNSNGQRLLLASRGQSRFSLLAERKGKYVRKTWSVPESSRPESFNHGAL